VTDNGVCVPRNREEVHLQLQRAALELFMERGFDATTAAEIAARAGVTERTFFRHYADKRDILFDGQDLLQTALTEAVANAPADLASLQILRVAFQVAAQVFEENRAFSEPRMEVIANTPALLEREAGKRAMLMTALASALEQRGVEAGLASLTVQVGGAAFSHALAGWLANTSVGFDVHLEGAFEQLRELSRETKPSQPQ